MILLKEKRLTDDKSLGILPVQRFKTTRERVSGKKVGRPRKYIEPVPNITRYVRELNSLHMFAAAPEIKYFFNSCKKCGSTVKFTKENKFIELNCINCTFKLNNRHSLELSGGI